MKLPSLKMPKPNMKARKSGRIQRVRRFLNRAKNLTAFVSVTDYCLKISDCYRVICLEFGICAENRKELDKWFKDRMTKLQLLLDAIAKVEDNIHVQYHKCLAEIKKHEEKQKGINQ